MFQIVLQINLDYVIFSFFYSPVNLMRVQSRASSDYDDNEKKIKFWYFEIPREQKINKWINKCIQEKKNFKFEIRTSKIDNNSGCLYQCNKNIVD